MRQWYYILDEQEQGPVQEDALVGLFEQDQLPSNAMVWTEGMEDWAPADQIEGLIGMPPVSSVTPSDSAIGRTA